MATSSRDQTEEREFQQHTVGRSDIDAYGSQDVENEDIEERNTAGPLILTPIKSAFLTTSNTVQLSGRARLSSTRSSSFSCISPSYEKDRNRVKEPLTNITNHQRSTSLDVSYARKTNISTGCSKCADFRLEVEVLQSDQRFTICSKNAKIKALHQEIDELEAANLTKTNDFDCLQQEYDEMKKSMVAAKQQYQSEIDALSNELNEMKQQLTIKNAQIAKYENEQRIKQSVIQQQTQKLTTNRREIDRLQHNEKQFAAEKNELQSEVDRLRAQHDKYEQEVIPMMKGLIQNTAHFKKTNMEKLQQQHQYDIGRLMMRNTEMQQTLHYMQTVYVLLFEESQKLLCRVSVLETQNTHKEQELTETRETMRNEISAKDAKYEKLRKQSKAQSERLHALQACTVCAETEQLKQIAMSKNEELEQEKDKLLQRVKELKGEKKMNKKRYKELKRVQKEKEAEIAGLNGKVAHLERVCDAKEVMLEKHLKLENELIKLVNVMSCPDHF